MTLSIRTKLTLWYTSLLGLSLLVSGILLYIIARQSMLAAADTKLLFLAETLARTSVKPETALVLPENFDILMERFFGIKTAGSYIQITDEFGKVIARSLALSRHRIPLSDKALGGAGKDKVTYETINIAGGNPLRIATYPIKDTRRIKYIVQVGTPMDPINASLNNIIFLFYLSIPPVLALATAIGFILAKKALSPVNEITETARRIGAQNLSERLAVLGTGDEIDRLAETFNNMIERLESSFKRIRQFTSDASHELRTPLTILKGETEIALRSCADLEVLKELLKSNLEEIDRMSNIVNNLLLLAKTDIKMHVEFANVRLNDIIEEKFRQIKNLAELKGINIRLEKNEAVVVKGDSVKIRQIVLNLLENAIKYTDKDGTVSISLERCNDNALIKITDTGIGIPEEDIPYIFDRFYRVDKARTEGGTGLGLSICKDMVTFHNGRIEVKSKVGEGSTFSVYLPLM